MKLPQGLDLPKTTVTWASAIEPALNAPLVQGRIITQVALANGSTTVNHGLGRKLVGWMVVGVNGAATVYDTQASNPMPQLTLQLVSNAAVTVNLWVF